MKSRSFFSGTAVIALLLLAASCRREDQAECSIIPPDRLVKLIYRHRDSLNNLLGPGRRYDPDLVRVRTKSKGYSDSSSRAVIDTLDGEYGVLVLYQVAVSNCAGKYALQNAPLDSVFVTLNAQDSDTLVVKGLESGVIELYYDGTLSASTAAGNLERKVITVDK